jgi:predicted translin family RNA/ssDNA-binding protein
MKPNLLLKWGTIKRWENFKEGSDCRAALQEYADISGVSWSAMAQDKRDQHRIALCKIIDAVADAGGEIQNDCSGEMMTRDDAKKYVMEYRK